MNTINQEHSELNISTQKEKNREHYKIPILTSLYEMDKETYWNPQEIQEHWQKVGYLKLSSEDRREEEFTIGENKVKRKVYKNRHAWALVELQQENLIEKRAKNIKEYKITEKGIRSLKEEGIIEN